MSEKTVNLSLKSGNIKLSYEGSETFLIEEISRTMEEFVKFCEAYQSVSNAQNTVATKASVSVDSEEKRVDLSVSTIATRLNISNAGEFVMACAAFLVFVNGMDAFSRDDLRKAMRSDKSRLTSSMLANLSTTIKRLVARNKLNELPNGSYSLTPVARDELEKMLD